MSDIVERLRHCSENCGDEYLHKLVGKAADRIEQLETALRWIDEQRYADRSTISQDNAFRKAVSLNERLVKIMDTALAALGETNDDQS